MIFLANGGSRLRMRLESIGCGAANERPNTVVVVKVGNDRFNVYASGRRVVVLSTDLVRLQELSMDSNVQALDACVADGKIAAVHGCSVVLLRPTASADPRTGPAFTWTFLDELTCDGPLEAVSWDASGARLLTGGVSITLWRDTSRDDDVGLQEEDDMGSSKNSLYVPTWRLTGASPVRFLRFSPDGRFFVSCGAADRLPKLWSRREHESLYSAKPDQYDYVFLPHPRAVRSLEWRPAPPSMEECTNALLTSCADNVARIWIENSGSLCVAGSIDADSLPGSETGFSPVWLNVHELFSELRGEEPHNPDSSIAALAPGPAMHRSASVDVLYTQPKTLPTFLSARPTPIASPSRSPVPDLAASRVSEDKEDSTKREHWPDVLVHISAAGSLYLWRLPSLDDPQRRSFRVGKPQIVENAFPAGTHAHRLLVYPDISSSYLHDTTHHDGLLPLAMLIRQRSGALAKYRVAIAERTQLSRVVSVEYVGGCSGHSRPVAAVCAHPIHPVVASVGAADDSAEIVFWLLTPPTVFASNVPEGRCAEAFRVSLPSPPTALCWLPATSFLALVVCLETEAIVYVCSSWPVRHEQFSFTETGRFPLRSISLTAFPGDHARAFRLVALTPPSPPVNAVNGAAGSSQGDGSAANVAASATAAVAAGHSTNGGSANASSLLVGHLSLSLLSHHPTVDWLAPTPTPTPPPGAPAPAPATSLVSLAQSAFAFSVQTDAMLGVLGAGPQPSLSLVLLTGTKLHTLDSATLPPFPRPPRALTCYLGRVAAAIENIHVAAGKPCRGEVLVYENSSTGLIHRLEDRLSVADPPAALAWLAEGTGAALLAVGQRNCVLIHAQYLGNVHGKWMLLGRIALAMGPCMFLAGAASGLLMVASETEIAVFSKWVAPEDWLAASHQATTFTAAPPPRPAQPAAPVLSSRASTTGSPTPSIPETPPPVPVGVPPPPPLVTMPSFSTTKLNSVISDYDAVNGTLLQCHPRQLLHLLMRGNRIQPRLILNHVLRVLSSAGLKPVPGTSRFPVPALPLATIARLEGLAASASARTDNYGDLFGSFGGPAASTQSKAQTTSSPSDGEGGGADGAGANGSEVDDAALIKKFDKAACEALGEHLSMRAIHGLSAVEQMSLVAIIEAFAAVDGDMHSGALDDCGVRFYFAARRHHALARTSLALRQSGLRPSEYAWAFFSDAHERLLELCFTGRATYDWSEFRALGAAYWVRSSETLRACCERIAKHRFSANRQPLEAALFYLALKKKNILWGLFRSVQDERMSGFMSNDFTTERWQSAALKNAFALLSKQRFGEAAAFFLLANRLGDAVQVCVSNLEDPHLAVFIARVYEGEGGPVLQGLLADTILPRAREHHDIYSICLVEWLLRNHRAAADALLSSAVHSEAVRESDAPALLSLYQFLRRHPQVCKVGALPIPLTLFRRTAYVFAQSGLPSLALDILEEMLAAEKEQADAAAAAAAPPAPAKTAKATTDAMIQSGIFNFDAFDFGFGPSTPSPAPAAAATAAPSTAADETAINPSGPERQAMHVGLQLDCTSLALQLVLRDLAGLQPAVADDDMRYLTTTFNTDKALIAEIRAHLLPASLLHERYPVAATALALEDPAVRDAGFNRIVLLLTADIFTALAASGAMHMPRAFPYHGSVSAVDGHVVRLLWDLSHCFQLACRLRVAFEPLVLAQLFMSFFLARFEQAFAASDTAKMLQACTLLADAGPFHASLFGSEHCSNFDDAVGALVAGQAAGVSLVEYFDTPLDERVYDEVDGLATLDAVETGPAQRDGQPVPDSVFHWTLLRLAATQQAVHTLRHCLSLARTGLTALPAVAPALHAVLTMLSARVAALNMVLVPLSVPVGLAKPRSSLNPHPAQQIFRVRGLLDVSSNPFQAIAPRRLWHFLLQREPLQQVFERAIYPPLADAVLTLPSPLTWSDACRPHGELTSLAVLAGRPNRMVVASTRSIFEYTLPSQEPPDRDTSDVRPPVLGGRASPGMLAGRRLRSIDEDEAGVVLGLQRPVGGVRHIAAHPTLGLYLAGSSDGAVRLFHFGSPGQDQDLRPGGSRVTHIAFDCGGDKFGVTDLAGELSLWRLGGQDAQPYVTLQAHAKRTDACTFLSSSSLVATGGLGVEGGAVVLWDTLMPLRQAAIHTFVCCDGGVRALLYQPASQRLVCGGKGGELYVFDIRQRSVAHRWIAAEGNHMVRALAMHGEQLVTASSDGTVRLWTGSGQLLQNWTGVHAKPAMHLTRPAISSVAVINDTLFSCGADGIVRQCQL